MTNGGILAVLQPVPYLFAVMLPAAGFLWVLRRRPDGTWTELVSASGVTIAFAGSWRRSPGASTCFGMDSEPVNPDGWTRDVGVALVALALAALAVRAGPFSTGRRTIAFIVVGVSMVGGWALNRGIG